MERLKQKIVKDGEAVGDSIVKVDSFLNHQLDVKLLEEMGQEFADRFKDVEINKILTVESSGIAVACQVAKSMGYIPVVFAKKALPNTLVEGCYNCEARSFTKGTVSNLRVSKKFLGAEDKVLIVDDFLATGEAALALAKIVGKSGAKLIGLGVVIEKEFQDGKSRLEELGCRVEALAVVKAIKDGEIVFG